MWPLRRNTQVGGSCEAPAGSAQNEARGKRLRGLHFLAGSNAALVASRHSALFYALARERAAYRRATAAFACAMGRAENTLAGRFTVAALSFSFTAAGFCDFAFAPAVSAATAAASAGTSVSVPQSEPVVSPGAIVVL